MLARKKSDYYIYPAVFTNYGPGKEISVVFPDLDCATSGVDEKDALYSAQECLGLVLAGLEEDGEEIPTPASISDIKTKENQYTSLIDVYMPTIRASNESTDVSRAVTLSA